MMTGKALEWKVLRVGAGSETVAEALQRLHFIAFR